MSPADAYARRDLLSLRSPPHPAIPGGDRESGRDDVSVQTDQEPAQFAAGPIEQTKARVNDQRANHVEGWMKEDNKRYYPQQAPPRWA